MTKMLSIRFKRLGIQSIYIISNFDTYICVTPCTAAQSSIIDTGLTSWYDTCIVNIVKTPDNKRVFGTINTGLNAVKIGILDVVICHTMDNEAWITKTDLNDRENEHKLEKLKESFLILKQKMCRSHDLIKQYNDKLKECERLKTDLDASNKEAKRLTNTYNSTLAKVIKLELQNTEYKKNIEALSKAQTEHQTKIAGEQQYIQQLTCKLKELEDQQSGKIMQYDLEKSSLQARIKELEQELRATKKTCDTKIKKMEKKIDFAEIDYAKMKKLRDDTKMTIDVAVNTTHDERLFNKVKIEEKCVMTDEFYKITDDPYPLFCAKCESALVPAPLEKICKVMSNACPEMIEKLSASLPQKLSLSSPLPCLKSASNLNTSSQMSLSSNALNQDNHDDVMITNPAPARTTIEMRKPPHCEDVPQIINTLSQVPNLMNQSDYYIGSTSSPLPISMQNVGNQANRYSDLAIASTLSIIDTLQKKVNTLETKMKQQLRRKRQVQDTASPQHPHISTCCTDSILNTSLQTNMSMQLWKRMMDYYDKSDKGNVEATKVDSDKKSNRHRLKKVKLKKCKRLKNVSLSTDAWSVEVVPRKARRNVVSSKFSKSTTKHNKYSCDTNISVGNEDITDSYNKISRSSMSNFSKSDTGSFAASRSHSESESQEEENLSILQSKSPENCDHEDTVYKDRTCSPECPISDSAEIESTTSTKIEMEPLTEGVQSATESLKSVGGETDSGILSDSVECNNVGRLETDTEILPDFVMSNKLDEPKDPELPQPAVVENNSIEETISTDVPLEHDEPLLDHSDMNECNETERAESILDFKANTIESTEILRECKEACEVVGAKKPGGQQVLVKQLRNLKRSYMVAGVSDSSEAPPLMVEGSNDCDTSRVVHNDDIVTAESSSEPASYVPRKKTRITHVPIIFVRGSESLKEHETLNKPKKKRTANYGLKMKALFDSDVEEDLMEVKQQALSSTDEDVLDIETNDALDGEHNTKHAVNNKVYQNHHNSVNSSHAFMTDKLETDDSEKDKLDFRNSEDTDKTTVPTANVSYDGELNSSFASEESLVEHMSLDEEYSYEDSEKKETTVECQNTELLDVSTKSEDPHPCSIVDEDHSEEAVSLNEEESCAGSKDITLQDSKDNNFKEPMVLSSPLSPEIQTPSYNVPQIKEFSHRHLPSMILQRASKPQNTLAKCENMGTTPKFSRILNDMNKIEVKSNQEVLESPASPSPEKMEISFHEVPECVQRVIPESVHVPHCDNPLIHLVCNNEPEVEKISLRGTPAQQMQQYVAANKKNNLNPKKELRRLHNVCLLTDNFVRAELMRLITSPWDTSVHWDVIKRMHTACGPRIIAKGIIDFLYAPEDYNRTLDNTYTPPAPIMAKAHQRIVTLLVDMETVAPNIISLVQSGIEYKLFRLNQAPERGVAEVLSRMYTVLARIKKDREKVRIFCCDALYCLGINAMSVIYTVLTCWPEVLPHYSANREILPKCIAHIILSQPAIGIAPKLFPLKRLVTMYYKYKLESVEKVLAELLAILKERHCNGLDTAILLIAKREGVAWTYKNIVRSSLLPMIINQTHPSIYRAFCLLGNIMRVFPVDGQDSSVSDIIEQLYDVFNSGEGNEEQQEGIASALLCLARHDFDKVASALVKWTPKMPLRLRTNVQLEGFLRSRGTQFWRTYLKKNKRLQKQ